MGYFIAFGRCINCNQSFGFNPHKVPSSSALTGTREPICEPCVKRINAIRVERGLAAIKPLPGAYDPADEDEE